MVPVKFLICPKFFDFEIEQEDVQMMADLKGVVGYSSNPDTVTW